MAYMTPDAKKEEYRKYLEKSGVVDSLTKVLVSLYEEPERPANAVDYLRRFLGTAAGMDVASLKAENERLRTQIAELSAKLDDANSRLQAAGL